MFATLTRWTVRSLMFGPVLLLAGGLPLARTPALALVGHLGGPTLAVAVQDHYAYVGHSFEFAVVDVADPTMPRRVGYLVLSANDIAVADHLAYVASRTGLAVVDIGDSAHPTQVGPWPLPHPAVSVAVASHYAYVVSQGGLSVIAVAHPAAPHLVGFVPLAGRLENVSLGGDLAYVTSNRGMYVLNIRPPSQPVEHSFVATAGYAEAAQTVDGTVYVADGEQGLQVLAGGQPAASALRSTEHIVVARAPAPTDTRPLRPDGYAEAVAVQGRYAFVAAGIGGMQVFDRTDRNRLTPVGTLALPGYTLDLAVSGDYAYVIDRYHGMAIVDITQPAAPRVVGRYATPGFTQNVTVNDTRAFVTTAPLGAVHLLESADPAHLYQTGWAATLDTAEAVAAVGPYVYVAGGYGGLEVMNVTNPGDPVRIAGLISLGYAQDVQLVDDYAYVATQDGLQIVDVTKPTQPRRVARYGGIGAVMDLVVTRRSAVLLGAAGRLQWLDLTTPATPEPVASLQVSRRATAVADADGYTYVAAGEEGLRIVAFGASTPVEVGAYATTGVVNDVVVAGRYAYLALLDQGVEVLDLADPAHPVAVARFDTPDVARRIAVHDDTLYVADRAGGLFLLKLLDR